MNDLNDVRKRIKRRRNVFDNEDKKSSFSLFRLFYHMIMAVMCICVLVLALLLNQKLNLIKLPAFMSDLHIESITNWLPFEDWFSLKEEAVSATPAYTQVSDNHYTNGTNTAYNAYHGVVLHIESDSKKLKTVTLKQDNGVVSVYGNLKETNVQEDERILKGKILGTYDTYVTIDFLKDNKTITYDKAFE